MPTPNRNLNGRPRFGREERIPPRNVAIQTVALNNDQISGGVWVNLRSGHLYKVTRIENEGAARWLHYVRVGTNDAYKLSIINFSQKFRLANVHEVYNALVTALSQSHPTDESTGAVEVGFLVEPDHRHDFSRMILFPDTIESIQLGLNKILRRNQMEEHWHLSAIEPRANRTIMNYYGPPGTGKTMAALAAAQKIGKKAYQVDYSQVISRHVGDTVKYIKAAFDAARRHDAILFWDEADSLMSKRVDMLSGDMPFATLINQNRNVLMQELDRFDGVVIMATNFFRNFDEAMLRRIAQHVPFNLPDATMREAIYKLHVPRREVHAPSVDWTAVANESEDFSGGDILNVCINAMNRVSMTEDQAQWVLTTNCMLQEARAIRLAKQHQAGQLNARQLSNTASTIPAHA